MKKLICALVLIYLYLTHLVIGCICKEIAVLVCIFRLRRFATSAFGTENVCQVWFNFFFTKHGILLNQIVNLVEREEPSEFKKQGL